MKAAGVEIGIFNPKGINMFKGSTNFRSHEKCLIIDNVLAVYGSSNIGDEYLGISPDRNA
jgi:cardiolipin synthase